MNAARPIVVFDSAPPETALEIVRQNPLIGPAATLCYQVLWDATAGGANELHCWPHELATRCGHRDRRCASDWLDTLLEARLVQAWREPRRPWRIHVLQPDFGPRRKPLAADPQGELPFGHVAECDADTAESAGNNPPNILRLATPVAFSPTPRHSAAGVSAQKPPPSGDLRSEHPPPEGIHAGEIAQKPPLEIESHSIDRVPARAARPSEPSEPLERARNISFRPLEPSEPLEPSARSSIHRDLQVERLTATILDRVNHWHTKSPDRFEPLYVTPALKVARFVLAGHGPARMKSLHSLLDWIDDQFSRRDCHGQPRHCFCGSHLARAAGVGKSGVLSRGGAV